MDKTKNTINNMGNNISSAFNSVVDMGENTINTLTTENNQINRDNENDNTKKNILFEVIDKELLEISGGIVQGMSGSPIIQNDKIIGAVTHVVVDVPTKGYGIFITNMLEEAEN